MGDHTTEMLEVQSSRDEKYARKRLLGCGSLYLDVDTISWIMNHIDCFVSQSRGNKSISLLKVCPHTPFGGHDDDAWEKFGQAIGNLQALEKLSIKTTLDCHDEAEDCEEDSDEDSDEVLPTESISDWEILARILRHVRQNVTVSISDERLRSMEEVLERFVGIPPLNFFRITAGSPTNPWILCFLHWRRFRLWNRSHFVLQK
jgi:hypothetical protein